MYITEEKQLSQLCRDLASCEMIAVDTEFVREKTYFHRLGLIQVAGNGICAAVDPIKLKSITPLLTLLKKRKILKVFHAGKQDLEILYRLCGEVIQPIFDTQVAAALVGWGAQISFAKIVHKVTGKRITKGETYSDWCRRPIRESQIEYALNDVKYLVPVYEYLVNQIEKMKRMEWVDEELAKLSNPINFELPDPRQQFLKLKNIRSLKPKNLAVLCLLAAWREEEARNRDCLAKSIIRDEPLMVLTRSLPQDEKAMRDIRGFHSNEIKTSGKKILEIIKEGLKMPEDEIPAIPESQSHSSRRGVEELLAAYIQIRSEELKVEPHLLADRKQIHQFVRHFDKNESLDDHPLLKGWRKDLIGSDLYSILDGQRGLAINSKGKTTLISIPKK